MAALDTIRVRRGTAAQWASANPVLLAGEPGMETDTGVIKYGDGSTAWLSLVAPGAPDSDTHADTLASGEDTFNRRSAVTGFGLTSGALYLSYFTAQRTEQVGSAEYTVAATAAGATPTLVRYGLYSIDGAGAGTLVASTPNDTALLAATFTAYAKAFSAPATKTRGQRYALALLVVSAAAMPAMLATPFLAVATVIRAMNHRAPAIADEITGQSDLPASFSLPSTGAVGHLYGRVFP